MSAAPQEISPSHHRDWRQREKVREVPATPKNYYQFMRESKEIVKVMSQLTNSFSLVRLVSNKI